MEGRAGTPFRSENRGRRQTYYVMLLAHEEIDHELGTRLKFHEGAPACQGAAFSAFCPFLTGDRSAAKFARGRVEPFAGITASPFFPARRFPTEERLQILMRVRHPCSVIKHFVHPRHPFSATLSPLDIPGPPCLSPFSPIGLITHKICTRIMPVIGVEGFPLKPHETSAGQGLSGRGRKRESVF